VKVDRGDPSGQNQLLLAPQHVVVWLEEEGLLDGRPAGAQPCSEALGAAPTWPTPMAGTSRAWAQDTRMGRTRCAKLTEGLRWLSVQSAVSSTSPMGSPVAAAKPMGMGVKVVGARNNGMSRTGHGIPVRQLALYYHVA